jgi:hypothetical protein
MSPSWLASPQGNFITGAGLLADSGFVGELLELESLNITRVFHLRIWGRCARVG